MALEIGLRILKALDEIGIKAGSFVGKSSNVKKAMFGGKPTMFKPNALEALRGTNANFDDALKLIENEAQFIVNATDVEKMAFLNNVNDYKQFGGPPKRSGILTTDEAKNLTDEAKDLETSITDLQTTAKSMKDDATANLKSTEDDLAAFFETGGNSLNKKDTKYLGGSMSEEGQIRTGIRQFLQKELKNGRINLDEIDAQRILQYSPMSEDDPILVFKKIYGDEAYNKAGSFPGAFNIGEDYNHYEKIFRENMGEDILKVKDKKYVGDGKLLLTEAEEVFTPSKFDDDIPFATGGRASFAGGKIIDEIILMLTKKEPMEAMKEVNKIIGKKGKYKNLTQKDIDRIVDQSNDHIFQRDPDNLFVEDRPMFKQGDDTVEEIKAKKLADSMSDAEIDLRGDYPYDTDAQIKARLNKKTLPEIDDKLLKNYNKEIKEGVADVMSDTSSAGLETSIEIDNLMLKYPGMDKLLARQIATDTNPTRKADVIAMVEQTFELNKQGKSGDEIIDIFKKGTDRTKQADGGITRLRNGYYGGGAAMVGEDLSEIGHGSDSLMARNMQLAPNSMATTSTGLNYLLGEDNDTVRVPYNEGNMVLPKPKPAQSPLVELSRIYKTYEDAMPGVSKDTQKYLQQDFIQKLNDAGISQEDFMTYRMQNNLADGGRAGYDQGGSSQPMGPEFSTNDPKEALKEIINRFIPIRDNPIPLLGNSQLMFNGLDNVQVGGQSDLFGGELNYGLKKSLKDDKFGFGFEFNKSFANGGVAGLRQGYAGGKGVNIARRGFLKILGGSVAAATAFKMGLVKMLGKESGAVSKKAVDEFFASGTSGSPTWFEPLVNKALKEGLDITEKAAVKDGQIVKQLDTPTGKVDVTYDTRTGAVDVDYMGGDTAMGEGLQMRYAPGEIIEGGANMGKKTDDVFEAVETVPEGKMYSPDDYQVEFGENMTSNIDDLYSDTSELATLGGEKLLVKDISNTLKKKKVLKEMDNNPDQFASDNLPDYDY